MSDDGVAEFHWLDYVLFIACLVLSLGVGIYHGYFKGGQKSTTKYLLGDKKMSIFPVAMSLIMSQVSGEYDKMLFIGDFNFHAMLNWFFNN